MASLTIALECDTNPANNLNTDKSDEKVKNCLLMIDDLKNENVEVA